MKNLMILANCSAVILRLKPQNDIVTQPPSRGMTSIDVNCGSGVENYLVSQHLHFSNCIFWVNIIIKHYN
jgi:hypothetical protein